MKNAQQVVLDLFALADVYINGIRPWDIKVHNPALFPRVIAGGSLALGESYMDGWWDCEALDQFFYRILAAELDKKVRGIKYMLWSTLISRVMNPQKKSKAYEIGSSRSLEVAGLPRS